jgi:hypothetical protein
MHLSPAKVLAAIALGAAINIGIATAASRWGSVALRQSVPQTEIEWPVVAHKAEFPARPTDFHLAAGTGLDVRMFAAPARFFPGARSIIAESRQYVVRAGFPLRSFWGVQVVYLTFMGQVSVLEAHGCIGEHRAAWQMPTAVSRSDFSGMPRVIPFRVLPLGFALNSLFYALLVLLLFRVRALWRRHRGLCERCRYPLLRSERCPECGLSRSRARFIRETG